MNEEKVHDYDDNKNIENETKIEDKDI